MADATYAPKVYKDKGGDRINVTSGGEINVEAGATVTGVVQSAANAAGYRIARGTVTLDGTNPTTAATGLTTIVAATVSLKSATAPADDPSWLSHNYTGSDGNLDIYAWKNTGGTDPTLVASTNNTATVDWIAIGT